MKKSTFLLLLIASLGLSGCGTMSAVSTNTPTATVQSMPEDIINQAEKMAQDGQAQAALELAMPYAQNNSTDGIAEGVIGYIYDVGLNDKGKAIEWLKKSARKGNKISQYNLGNMYYDMHDYGRAYDYYEDSAKQGDNSATTQLGVLYYYGKGVSRDYRKAAQYFQQAQQNGEARAHYFLALCYLESHGVPQDLDKARELLKTAERNGIKAATTKLDELGWL